MPEDVLRQGDVFGKRSVTVHTENPVVTADVRLAGATLEARSTREVGFCGDVIAGLDESDRRADVDDFSAHFMPDNTRRMNAAVRPGVPIVDMGVGAAQRRRFDADDGVMRSRCWIGTCRRGETGFGCRLDQGAHESIVSQSPLLAQRT